MFNPLTTNSPQDIETSQLSCNANQSTGFYMMGNILEKYEGNDYGRVCDFTNLQFLRVKEILLELGKFYKKSFTMSVRGRF